MAKYICPKCGRESEQLVPVRNLSCARSIDGIDHNPVLMEEAKNEG